MPSVLATGYQVLDLHPDTSAERPKPEACPSANSVLALWKFKAPECNNRVIAFRATARKPLLARCRRLPKNFGSKLVSSQNLDRNIHHCTTLMELTRFATSRTFTPP